MNIRPLLIFSVLSAAQICAVAQKEVSSVPRTINLQQAVELALEHNHGVRISSLKVEEDEHAKEVAPMMLMFAAISPRSVRRSRVSFAK